MADLTPARRTWTEAAPGWRKWRNEFELQSRAATSLILDRAQLTPGARVLDLASGAGQPAASIAQAVGPHGHVFATDFVPEMLLGARDLVRSAGLQNLTLLAADAGALPFPPSTFDCVTCRFGLMFFPDAHRALEGIRAVLRPGGRAVFAVWATGAGNDFHATTTGVIERFVAPDPAAGSSTDAFKFAAPETLSSVLKQAGFRAVEERRQEIPWPWTGSVEDFWDFNLEFRMAFRKLFNSLPVEVRESAKQAVFAELTRYYDGSRINLSGQVIVGSGVRP
jgi:ubiquinone/menaquinone biosynthesis C-methylase UbiE